MSENDENQTNSSENLASGNPTRFSPYEIAGIASLAAALSIWLSQIFGIASASNLAELSVKQLLIQLLGQDKGLVGALILASVVLLLQHSTRDHRLIDVSIYLNFALGVLLALGFFYATGLELIDGTYWGSNTVTQRISVIFYRLPGLIFGATVTWLIWPGRKPVD